METLIRKPFQGVLNVVRFNWHFYVLAFSTVFILLASTLFVSQKYTLFPLLISSLILIPTFFSLVVTYYIYDYSKIYNLNFIDYLNIKSTDNLVNINAGFEEFSFIIVNKFKTKNLEVFDFYNPLKHTEISIERARKISKVYPNTATIETSKLPLEANSVAYVFLFFAAHEIREQQERVVFFQEIEKVLNQNGKIIILEHLRDLPNFMAYTIGFFHFLSKSDWQKTFKFSNLSIKTETKITPFLSLFILQKNGSKS
jgi:SAM-dependent methyltransferase